MSNEGSQIDCDLNIYFIITDNQESENDCSGDMWHAFNSCDEHELSPKWIREKYCDKLTPGKKDIFVLEEFEGPTFEALQKFKCSIVGPRCLLNCFMTGEPIPEGNHPVFTTAMRGLVVSVSGLSSDAKKAVGQKIEYMGGVFIRQLRSCVTHLVTNFVMTEKYEAAFELKIPVMTEEWVTAVWKASLVENVRATSSRFDKYKCPVFMNMVVTCTNLSKQIKLEIKQLITDHGGTFMGSLDGTRVKLVITPEKPVLSDKIKYALENNIACVKYEWVYESIKHGYALPFSKFLINSTKQSSTPKKSHGNATLNFSCMSTIAGDQPQHGIIEETMSTMMSTTMSSVISEHSPISEFKAAYVEVLERLNVNNAKKAGPFLDGCNIYLAGFPPDHREKLNRILNVGSATRLDNISDTVTHVIVGNPRKASSDMKLMKSMELNPYFLTVNWIEESIKIKSTAPEEDFKYEQDQGTTDEQKMEPQSPLSKKNLQLLQVSRRPPVPLFDINKKMNSTKEIDEPDLVQEYRKSNVSSTNDKTLQEIPRKDLSIIAKEENSNTSSSKTSSSIQNEHNNSEYANDTTVPLTQPSELGDQFLTGLKFVLSGFDDLLLSNLISSIEDQGGEIVRNSFKGIPDFAVVPINGAPLKHTVKEIVTDLFIEDCIDQTALVDVDYYHKPISLSEEVTPLTDCVITMSTYSHKERIFLSKIAELLGARHQDAFARKVNPSRNLFGCTHLVCPAPEGSKYNAAVKWKVPVVTADWLLACIAQQRRVAETPYLVGESIAEVRSEDIDKTITSNQANQSNPTMGPPRTSNTRLTITPIRNTPLSKDSGLTPGMTPINKRLDIGDYKTPSSPQLSTPDSPYGQLFKPNPSHSTRKRWLQWADGAVDMRVDEPPLKRRAPSTPLSDLKKQMRAHVKLPFGNQNQTETAEEVHGNETAKTSKLKEDNVTNNLPPACNTPIKKTLSFGDENSPSTRDEIDLQIAQLDQVLQASTPETRHSSSAESVKQAIINHSEPTNHMAKCPVKDSQPDTVGWEDPVHTALRRKSTIPEEPAQEPEDAEKNLPLRQNTAEIISQKRKFMLSGIKDRSGYETIIKALGGEVSKQASFDPTATHLLCFMPGRYEKFLASIAAGKWVLHVTYLKHSSDEGTFLDEEKYEWGNPKSENFIPQPSTENERQMAASAHRWRLKLMNKSYGAFNNIVALLMGPEEKCQQFKRLICAGGGTVVEARPPYNTSPKSKKITHCFIQVNQLDQPVDWAMMASKGILCFLPQYLSDFLIAEEPLDPKKCVLPEFRKYLSLLPK